MQTRSARGQRRGLAYHGYEERHEEANEKTRAATYQLVRKYL